MPQRQTGFPKTPHEAGFGLRSAATGYAQPELLQAVLGVLPGRHTACRICGVVSPTRSWKQELSSAVQGTATIGHAVDCLQPFVSSILVPHMAHSPFWQAQP
eukprot:TRINITY_DN11326_c0_g1_i1.p4 TRINITY_DN11326_c0_g1~~TRINITY_DN11326_c0_g1_i1.p4  ORF type:complete len:102 (-),score=1.05 TRINITY_DN11326_c0_g1_i1:114-419(-)